MNPERGILRSRSGDQLRGGDVSSDREGGLPPTSPLRGVPEASPLRGLQERGILRSRGGDQSRGGDISSDREGGKRVSLASHRIEEVAPAGDREERVRYVTTLLRRDTLPMACVRCPCSPETWGGHQPVDFSGFTGWCAGGSVQGYLAHDEIHPPRTLP